MSSTPYSLTTRSAALRVARAYDGQPRAITRARAAVRPRLGGRAPRSLPRWALHAVAGVLALSPLLLARAWDVPLSAPLAGREIRIDPAGSLADAPVAFARASLPALGPLAEDERPLVARIAQYHVMPGDTLSTVAERFGISSDTLLWANPLPDPDHLVAGQELTVPPVSGMVYTVSPGDSVAQLAERYGAKVPALIEANALEEPYALEVGARLLIPDGRPPPGTTLAHPVPWPAPGTGAQYRQQFIAAAAVAAQETQRRYGVPASVAIAQAIHETGWGASLLAREGNNFFGIKGRNSEGTAGVVWMSTWEVVNGVNLFPREPFRAYNTPDESFLDYGLFFHANQRYHAALAVAHDPRAFIRAISAAGFATDPVYPAKIIRVMDTYDLYQYDLP
ncbi:MAG TPA: glucosaminidase domain-containing protein [Chloroflexota bacterium]|nr:glucosaminidase domain-containing protein [Chloroflexota bacterium]